MKKALLLSGLLVVSGISVQAFNEPQVYPNASFQGISKDGRWVASWLMSNVTIYDLQNGKEYTYEGDEYNDPQYSGGLGNFISNTGIVLGSTSAMSNAAYWQNGEWHLLETGNAPELMNLSNGITPDGSRICGDKGLSPVSLEKDNIMLAPVYWDLKADGTYDICKDLPYPTLDFTGRAPQYVTANCISDDGKVIAGQIVDCRGMAHTPIVYIQNEDGKWNYKILLEDIFYPKDMEMPAAPGDAPEKPKAEDYFTEEEKAAYDEAYAKFQETGDYTLYPYPEDFLKNEEGKKKYDEDVAAWQVKYDEWQAAYDAFDEAYFKIVENAPEFDFNDVRLSPDGKTYYSNAIVIDDSDPNAWFPASNYVPWAIDIATGEVTKYQFEGIKSMQINCIPNDEVILAFNGVSATPAMEGYIIKDGTCTRINEWLAAFSPELAKWIDENLVKEVEVGYDPDTFDPVYGEVCITGMPIASGDLKTLALWNDAPTDMTMMACGYVFDLGQFAGLKDTVIVGKETVGFDAAGNLKVDGELKSLELYDIAGRRVLSVNAPNGTVECNLPSGIYIVRATTPNCTFSAKIAK